MGKLMECGELVHGKRFPPKQKGAVYKSYARPEIQYGIGTWRLKENKKRFLRMKVPW